MQLNKTKFYFFNYFSNFLVLISIPLITILYSPEDYSDFSLILIAGTLLSALATCRLEYVLIGCKSRQEKDALVILSSNTLIYACILFSVCYLLIPTTIFDGKSIYIINIPFTIVLGLTNGLMQIGFQASIANNNYTGIILHKITLSASVIVCQVLFGLASLGVTGLVIAQVIGYTLTFILHAKDEIPLCASCIRELKSLKVITSTHRRTMGIYATTVGLNHSGPIIIMYALSEYFGPQISGFYALSQRIFGAPITLIASPIGTLFSQSFSILSIQKGGDALAKLYASTAGKLLLIGIPVQIFTLFCLLFFAGTFLGPKWANITQISSPLILMYIADFIMTPISLCLIYLNRHNHQLIWETIRLISIAAALYFCISNSLSITQTLFSLSILWAGLKLLLYWMTRKELVKQA